MTRKAVLFGATGLVGRELLYTLLENENYSQVICYSRQDLPLRHQKLVQHKLDFMDLKSSLSENTVDDLFCCLGTTIKKAGSQTEFEKVDYSLVVQLAEIACKAGVSRFIGISSIGADPGSGNFYLRVKGKMEQTIQNLAFKKTIFVRPSVLFGTRHEWRFGEEMAKIVLKGTGFLFIGPLRKYRGIKASDVARAMVVLALSDSMNGAIESEKLQELADKYQK